MLCYRDILFPLQTLKNSNEIRLLFSLHALNHILKTRTVILENNQLLEDASKKDPLAVECEYRDQGFTRPTVLIITPFRENAFEIASSISSLTGFKQVENKKKFNQDYHDDTVSELISKKSADFDATFKGNIDDCFKFGIRISRNSCKIYSDFYSSDILIASPLALRMLEQDPKKESFDFLSSIEIVMVDSCDVLNMQNWDHVQFIFNNLNKIPKESHDTDFSRVKRFWLDQNGSKLRQTIFSSRYMFPDLNNLTSSLSNIAGRIKFSSSTKPAVSKIVNQIPQSFYKINSKSIKDCDDDRFNFFRDKLLTQISNQPKTIVFIPSYFDFVRVRNYLKESLYSFAQLSEYSTPQNISRSRLNFFQGKVKILIVSERFHFFKRYNLRGCHHICFYGLPDRQDFYQDFVDGIDIKESIDATCNVLFTKYDRLKLERIVGVARCEKMIEDGSKEAFLIT